jgi:hypothetical protein
MAAAFSGVVPVDQVEAAPEGKLIGTARQSRVTLRGLFFSVNLQFHASKIVIGGIRQTLRKASRDRFAAFA